MTQLMRKINALDPFRWSIPTLLPTDVFDDMNRLLEDTFGRNVALLKDFPKGDIWVEDNHLVLQLALAGYSKEQLSVKVEGNQLVVSAVKGDSDKEAKRSLKRSAFTRRFESLSDDWDLTKADVVYRDGLLTIKLPPLEQVKPVGVELEIK